MKRIVEKVVLIALICITFVFALTTILYVTNVIPQDEIQNNSVAVILLSVLAAIYIGLATYLVYVNFSERINVKRILLFYDAKSATRASSRVVDNIVKGSAKQVKNLKVRKTTLRVDEKQGLVATVHVEVTAERVTTAIPELRELLVHNFDETLGLKFNAINFEIDKLVSKFVPQKENTEAEVNVTETNPTTVATVADSKEQTVDDEDIETMEAQPIESPLSELFKTLEELETSAETKEQDATDEEIKADIKENNE